MNQEEFTTALTPVGDDPAEGGTVPEYHEWCASGDVLRVRLSFDVIDQINFEVMRGFGAIPKRGAEVGGLLIGYEEEESRLVTVTGFEPLPCRHSRGPSYVLDEDEMSSMAEALTHFEPGEGRETWAVGFFRSNTRESLELAEDDQAVLDRFFPADPGVCLMVRPFATRVSEAVIFYRKGGVWATDGVDSVFPFRRKELGGGKRPRRPRPPAEDTAATEGAHREESASTAQPFETAFPPTGRPLVPPPPLQRSPSVETIPIPDVPEFAESRPSRLRGSWVWIPLSFVFLLLGIVLGFQIALSVSKSQKAAEQVASPYALELTAVEFGESLHLKWNSNLPAFRNATSGVLHIQDGNNTKTVEITRDDIARGGILYRNATSDVHFKLEIPQGERTSVSESVDLRLLPNEGKQR